MNRITKKEIYDEYKRYGVLHIKRIEKLTGVKIDLRNSKRNKGIKCKKTSSRWRTLRKKVLSVYGDMCMCCGVESSKPPQIDHIVAPCIAPELMFDIRNMQVLCEYCNSHKSTRILDFRSNEDLLKLKSYLGGLTTGE